jgi:hypothetical protein
MVFMLLLCVKQGAGERGIEFWKRGVEKMGRMFHTVERNKAYWY